jgi:hypothetical protein
MQNIAVSLFILFLLFFVCLFVLFTFDYVVLLHNVIIYMYIVQCL